MNDGGFGEEFGDEEVLGGRHHRERRSLPPGARLGVAVLVAALAAGGLLYATSRQSAARRPTPTHHVSRAPSTRPAPTGTPLAIVDNEVVEAGNPAPSDNGDLYLASDALGEFIPTSRRNPDGTLNWNDDLVNNYPYQIQLGEGPIRVHVAPGLYARVLSVRLLQHGVQMTPGTGIREAEHVQLRVRLRVDCSQVDPATSRFPDVPIAVVIKVFGFTGAATFVLGPTPGRSAWRQVCPG